MFLKKDHALSLLYFVIQPFRQKELIYLDSINSNCKDLGWRVIKSGRLIENKERGVGGLEVCLK